PESRGVVEGGAPAVSPPVVVQPDHDLVGPVGVRQPDVVGGLGDGSRRGVHGLGEVRVDGVEARDGRVGAGGLGEQLLYVGIGQHGGVPCRLVGRDLPVARRVRPYRLEAALVRGATTPPVVGNVGVGPVGVGDRRV